MTACVICLNACFRARITESLCPGVLCTTERWKHVPEHRNSLPLDFSSFIFFCICRDKYIYISVERGVILFTNIMQINATYPWLIQPSQPELTGTPKGYLISGWFYILREGLGISWLFFPLFLSYF